MSDEYQEWLNSDRKNREFHFQIAMALAKIRAKFSYLRLEGIAELIRFLRSLKEEDYECFCLLQDVEENNIALHVMKNIIEPTFSSKSHKKSDFYAISKTELLSAMDLLQGCLLIHHPSKKLVAIECRGLEIMLHYIENGSSSIQMEAMDTLLSMLVDSEEIQSEFRKLNGIHRIVALLKNKEMKREVRIKASQFLLFLVRYFVSHSDENKRCVQQLLGDKLTELLTTAVQLNPSKEKNEKFDNFLKQLDSIK